MAPFTLTTTWSILPWQPLSFVHFDNHFTLTTTELCALWQPLGPFYPDNHWALCTLTTVWSILPWQPLSPMYIDNHWVHFTLSSVYFDNHFTLITTDLCALWQLFGPSFPWQPLSPLYIDNHLNGKNSIYAVSNTYRRRKLYMKSLTRNLPRHNTNIWEENVYEIGITAAKAKFSQNPEMAHYLASTGEKHTGRSCTKRQTLGNRLRIVGAKISMGKYAWISDGNSVEKDLTWYN